MIKEIWCEGDPTHDYTACHLGYGKGSNLREACEELASRNSYFNNKWDRKTMTYWGCSIFDNEEEARDKWN